jgi:dTDP-glucose 4,6-dehydratase
MTRCFLVTGGAGFIGSHFVRLALAEGHEVVNLDKLTYAGNVHNLDDVMDHPAHHFVHGDIGDAHLVSELLSGHRVNAVVHFAAESHVDRSIEGPRAFIDTNVLGTYQLLECARAHWSTMAPPLKDQFRFLHVSTDEVFGSLNPNEPAFTEMHRYEPNSPYSASKAASDHLVRAWHHTYGLPVLTTNCSNNYGPHHFPEKLIPLMILNALQGQPLPIYGDGQQVRDWLYVEDHCRAILKVLANGQVGETYNIGGHNEKTNLEVVQLICETLDQWQPRGDGVSYAQQITSVKDRPGHDRRYAMDAGKIQRELHWQPLETFETGLAKTIRWYLDHPEWVANIQSGAYRDWMQRQYNQGAHPSVE